MRYYNGLTPDERKENHRRIDAALSVQAKAATTPAARSMEDGWAEEAWQRVIDQTRRHNSTISLPQHLAEALAKKAFPARRFL